MQPTANPVITRLLSLLCFCLTLLTAVPCTAATQPVAQMAMTAHCAPCCKSSPVAVNTLCCQAHPQPTQAATSTDVHETSALATHPVTHPATPYLIAIANAPTPLQSPTPPLLHPILRI